MTKVKKLELEIEALKREIVDLRKDMLALALRQPVSFPYVAPTLPNTVAPWTPNRPYTPYIGDPIWPNNPTITSGTATSGSLTGKQTLPFLSAMQQVQNLNASN